MELRSNKSILGREMAGARALWAANGMKKEQLGKPIIAIVNSFTQFVPGHTHLHKIGQEIKAEIERIEALLDGCGRVLIRPSGTEPLVRVMLEGKEEGQIKELATNLVELIKSKLS